MGRKKTKTKIFQTLTGMNDILPKDQPWWEKIRKVSESVASFYGFKRIDTPILEETDLFIRSVGENTEIIEKQMFSFTTKGGNHVVLRPEETAGVCRAYTEQGLHTLTQPVKLYYIGPMFRYESPQKGRYRQFHQFGVEIIGGNNPVIEAQIVQLFFSIFSDLGLKNVVLEINTMGCKECRGLYKKLLSSYYKSKANQVCQTCRKRIKTNILRILDCKEEKCIITRHNAPQIVNYICESCKDHFKKFIEFLDELDLPYALNPYLVRGLNYYNRTVFEFLPREYSLLSKNYSEKEISSQIALGGGGRYDYLIKLLGGRDTPAAGGALGLERIIEEMKNSGSSLPKHTPQVFLVQIGELAKKKSLKILEDLRKSKISVTESLDRDSIKAQLGLADKLKVRYALILGQKEALENTIILREMEVGEQKTVPLDSLIKELKKRLKQPTNKH